MGKGKEKEMNAIIKDKGGNEFIFEGEQHLRMVPRETVDAYRMIFIRENE